MTLTPIAASLWERQLGCAFFFFKLNLDLHGKSSTFKMTINPKLNNKATVRAKQNTSVSQTQLWATGLQVHSHCSTYT